MCLAEKAHLFIYLFIFRIVLLQTEFLLLFFSFFFFSCSIYFIKVKGQRKLLTQISERGRKSTSFFFFFFLFFLIGKTQYLFFCDWAYSIQLFSRSIYVVICVRICFLFILFYFFYVNKLLFDFVLLFCHFLQRSLAKNSEG